MDWVLKMGKWFFLATVFALLCLLPAGGDALAQETTAPAAPAIESLTPGDQAIIVVWSAPGSDGGSEVTGYDLRYIESNAQDKADASWTVRDSVWTSGELTYTITSLTNGTQYDVQLRAVNDIDDGPWSATFSGKTATVPGAPILAYARARTQSINVVWSKPRDNGGDAITHYDLRYIRSDGDATDDANWTLRERIRTGASSYLISGLTNGVAYFFQIRAVNSVGAGPWFDRATRTPVGRPGPPNIETVTPGDKSLTITWSAPASNGGLTITSYDLRYIRDDAGDFASSSWTVVSNIWSSGDLTYTLSGLQNSVRYRLSVAAVNSEGGSSWSNFNPLRTGTPGDTPELPAAPTIGRAISSGTTMEVRWSAPSDDGGADISSYDLRYIRSDATDKADANWTVRDSVWTSGGLSYTLTDLTEGVQYDLQLRAENSAGNGPWSATVKSASASVPGAPVLGFSDWEPGGIWISWVSPDDDGGASITGYDVRYIRSDATDKADVNWTVKDGLPGTSYTITGLTNNVQYDVQVRAVNSVGGGAWSAIRNETPRAKPGAPTGIWVASDNGKLTANWSAPVPVAGATITGYRVRHIVKEAPGHGNLSNWTASNIISADTLQYEITGLDNGVRYWVLVRAVNAYGDESTNQREPYFYIPGSPPGALTELKRIRTAESSIFISWIGPADNGGIPVSSYDIHHHPTAGPTNVVEHSRRANDLDDGPSATNNTWVGNLTPHVEYKIKVRARNAAGAGPWSSLTLIPRKKPSAVTVASLTPGDGALTASWTDAGDDEITGYELRYTGLPTPLDLGPDSPWFTYIRNITGTSPLTYTIDGLTNGVQYKVQVRARNKYGVLSSDWSGWNPTWIQAIPRTVPDAPSVGSVSPDDGTLTVAWSAPASNGGARVSYYGLRYIRSDAADKSDGNWTVKIHVWGGSGRLRHELIGLTNGVSYDVQLRAGNAAGAGAWSASGNGTPRTTAGAPTISSVSSGDKSLTVSWSAPTDNGGTEITGYDLRYIESDAQDKSDPNWTVKTGIWGSGDLRHELDGLSNGVQYDAQLRAVSVAGNGLWSASMSGTPLTTAGLPAIDSLSPGDETLTIAWFVPASDGGADITGYDLRYIEGDSQDKADANWTVRESIWSSGDLRYEIGGLSNGVAYDIEVRAVNVAGKGVWSASISGAPGTIPAAPTIDSMTSGDGALTIAWSAPTDTGGRSITGYDLRYIESDAPDRADDNWTVEGDIWTAGDLEHTVSDLTNGVRYDVQLRAVTSAGDGPWSAATSGTPRTVADAPSINLITSRGNALVVAWSAPASDGGAVITSYDLRYIRSDAPDKTDADEWDVEKGAGSSGSLEHTITGLTNGVGYDVQLRAVNAAGAGPWSDSATGTPQAKAGPPSIDSLTPGSRSLVVAWSAPDSDGGAVITSYDVRYIRSDAPDKTDGNWAVEEGIWSSGTLRYTLSGLTGGAEHDVQVRAVNAAGVGSWSATVSGRPQTVPGPPAVDSLTAGHRSLTVAWSAPASDGGAEVTSYDLRYIRSDATDKSDANWTVRDSIWSSGNLGYTLGSLSNGVEYDVQVRGVNSVGEGSWSASATGRPQTPPEATPTVTVPGAPTSVLAAAGDGSLSVTWSPPHRDGGADITSYDLRYTRSDAQDKSDANWTVRDGVWNSGSLSYTLGSLTNGVGYDVQLRATNSAGSGPWSGSAAGTPATAPPPPPETTTPGAPTISAVTAGDGTLTVSWTAPPYDGGSAISGYRVQWKSGSDQFESTRERVVGATPLAYVITGLTNGTEYEVRVAATNINGDGSPSAVSSGTPTEAVVPTISGVGIDSESITQSEAVAIVSIANTDEESPTTVYLRHRSVAPAGEWHSTQTGSTTTGSLEFDLSDLSPGAEYEVQASLDAAFPAEASVSVTFTTASVESTVPGVPVGLVVTTGDGELTVSWSAPEDGGSAIVEYRVEWKSGDEEYDADREAIVRALSHTITGLTNGTTYDVRVTAVNINGSGTAAEGSGTPTESAVTVISGIRVTADAVETTTATVTVSVVNSDGQTRTIRLRYRVAVAEGETENEWIVGPAAETTSDGEVEIELSGLNDGTEYEVQASFDGSFPEGTSPGTTFTTLQTAGQGTAPGTPSISEVSVGDGELTVSWEAPQEEGTAIVSYDLRHIRSDAEDKSDDNWTVETGIRIAPPGPDPDPTAPADPCATDLGTLSADVTEAGSWSDDCDSANRSDRYASYYTFTLEAETEVQIDLTSDKDPYLFLLLGAGRDGTVEEENDDIDYGVELDSRIGPVTLGAGTYTVEATTYASGVTGGFTLTIDVPEEDAEEESAGASTPLTEPDVRSDVALHYTLSGLENGVKYDVQLRAVNEAGSGEWSATATGTPAIPAPDPDPTAPADPCATDLGTLSADVTEAGSWSDDCDSANRSDRYASYYTFTLEAETEVQIDLTSDKDPYLFLLLGAGRDGTVEEENDDIDYGVELDSRIGPVTLGAGTYTVEATTYASGVTGGFTLTIDVPEESTQPGN